MISADNPPYICVAMLTKLHIRNYAIIDELTIQFRQGFHVITGETGAGKSIIMGALGLILGDRADGSLLLNRQEKCVVEGFFSLQQHSEITNWLNEQELDEEPTSLQELIVRREISVSGKSRAFVNDTPVTLEVLKQLTGKLVDLHRQFDTLEIGNKRFQLNVLDALAGQQEQLLAYQTLYDQWVQLRQQYAQLEQERNSSLRDLDYFQFQLQELEEWNFAPEEIEQAESELKILEQADQLQQTIGAAVFHLSGGEQPIANLLKQLVQQLQGYSLHLAPLAELVGRLRSVQIEVADISDELERLSDQVQHQPEKIQLLQERTSAGYRLFKKHGVASTQELLTIQKELAEKVEKADSSGELLQAAQEKMDSAERLMLEAGAQLSSGRKRVQASLVKRVNELLKQVGMPNAQMAVQIEIMKPDPTGVDAVEFLFDANNSGRFEPVRKVASGGELSRLMLCIKSLVSNSLDMPTLIFDEIDTGISGEAARQVGLIMKEMGENRQVLCITHQPQIAGRAFDHYYVYKQERAGAVRTSIRVLNQEERVRTIAEMIGGEMPSAAALENARELLQPSK